jgi:predicted acyltransferase
MGVSTPTAPNLAPPSTPAREAASKRPGATPAVERLLALDVFRGITIAGMLLVNHPGSWSAIYAPLRHAEWHGWTPTDLIFPFFLFIVGVTTHLSLESRRARGATDGQLVAQVLRRGALIVLFGLLVAAFPYIPVERITGMRIPGVLQRIGIAYIVSALIAMRTSVRQQVVIAGLILVGYWAAMALIPVPGVGAGVLDRPDATLAAYVDRLLLDGHLWAQSRTWDPEGPLSTLPAIVTAMLGVLTGRWIASKRPLLERVAALFAAGVFGAAIGAAWGWAFPINKNIWTSSYVIFTAGLACLLFATCLWLIDVQRLRGWTRPFVIFGMNPLLAFVGSGVLARVIYSLVKVEQGGAQVAIQTAIYRTGYASWLPAKVASLAFALTVVAFWFVVLWGLHKKGVVLKV